jgi:hypothetical protein
MWQLNKTYGLRHFFGTDDNFFNTKSRTLEITETLARKEFDGVPLRRKVRWSTEVTVHDTLQMKDHLPLVRESGCRALWLGVEDMTATLVKKGRIWDRQLFEHLDAGETTARSYTTFLFKIPGDFAGVESIKVDKGRLTLRERGGATPRELSIDADGLPNNTGARTSDPLDVTRSRCVMEQPMTND